MTDERGFERENECEHEHEQKHECEHEHEQEHDCEHEHGHEHGHQHGHGSHHEHGHREQFAIEWGEAFLEAHMHDQAATVSIAICPDESEVIPFAYLTDALSAAAADVETAGGIIGHIKAFARQEDAFAHASVTVANRGPDVEGDVTASFGSEADIQLVAIALLIDQDKLISICKQALLSH